MAACPMKDKKRVTLLYILHSFLALAHHPGGVDGSSISGVDKDEEAVSLVKYQNSFTLASKMIQTLTEIYDRLILETGV